MGGPLDEGERDGLDWSKFRIDSLVGGEGMTEELRDALLELGNPLIQLDNLGAERHLVFDRGQTHFDGINPLLEAFDGCRECGELAVDSIELLVHMIEAGVHLIAQLANDALAHLIHIRLHYIAVKLPQHLERVRPHHLSVILLQHFESVRLHHLLLKSQQRLPKLVFGHGAILSPVSTMPRA